MKVHVLVPAEGQGAARYPKRTVVQEFDNIALDQVIEEVVPPDRGWLVAYDQDQRVFHFYEDHGKWRFQSMAVLPAAQPKVEV